MVVGLGFDRVKEKCVLGVCVINNQLVPTPTVYQMKRKSVFVLFFKLLRMWVRMSAFGFVSAHVLEFKRINRFIRLNSCTTSTLTIL